MREAPSRDLIEALWGAGAKVRAYDPVAMREAARIYGNARRPGTRRATPRPRSTAPMRSSIVTEWQEFRSPDFDTIRDRLTHPVIFDGRNLYEPALVKSFGLKYHGIGRGNT